MPPDLIIKSIGQFLTLYSSKKGPRTGKDMQELGIIENGAVAIKGDRIISVGKTGKVLSKIKVGKNTKIIDAKDKVVTPGLVDCHTHPIFASTREEEFELRIKGKTYEEIARAGGGIKSSVKQLRTLSKEELIKLALPRLDRFLSYGTTTIEAKSGYGLSLEDEIKILDVIRELNKIHPIDLVPTFLGAHEFPEEYKNNKKGYIKILTEEMIPLVAKRKLAKFCDIFCEKGVFDIKNSRRILLTAKKYGLVPKLHAEQLSHFGGAKLAGQIGAVCADHLENVTLTDIKLLKKRGVIGVLLPGATFGLGLKNYAPARVMIENGLPVAISTDFNPGSSMSESLPMMMSLSCLMMKMTPAEAIVASTINPAYVLSMQNQIGSIELGKKADLVIWEVKNHKEIPYHYGINLVENVIKNGKVLNL
ncbi:MAG: imidazolonepropionase [candidate division Zixibacteria bacterium]|nr:imidazolonepropionase [candidate division Zixibacteria bacterium]